MAFFDYDRNGKKDWKDNAREYYLYNKLKEDDASKHSQGKKESSDDGKSNVGCGFCTIVFFIYVLYDVVRYEVVHYANRGDRTMTKTKAYIA